MYTLKIGNFKKTFKINDRYTNLKDNEEIHAHLLKYYRIYVISKKMQNAIRIKNYTLIKN